MLVHTSDDGHRRTVLRDEACSVAARGEHDDRAGILLRRRSHRGKGDGFDGFRGTAVSVTELVVQSWIADGVLCEQARLRHHEN